MLLLPSLTSLLSLPGRSGWHFGLHRLLIGGARPSKVVVSHKRGIKIAKSHFLRHFGLEWFKKLQSGVPNPPKDAKIVQMGPQVTLRALVSGSFSIILDHFEEPRSRRVLNELAGHLRAST